MGGERLNVRLLAPAPRRLWNDVGVRATLDDVGDDVSELALDLV